MEDELVINEFSILTGCDYRSNFSFSQVFVIKYFGTNLELCVRVDLHQKKISSLFALLSTHLVVSR